MLLNVDNLMGLWDFEVFSKKESTPLRSWRDATRKSHEKI